MTSALYDRLDAIEAFAADVSHELKNPLTSLGTAVETFERIEDEEKRRQLADVIKSDVKRLDRLITDISAASRLDAELSRSELEPVDLESLINGVVESYGRGNDTKKVKIQTLIMRENMTVLGLPDRLGQVMRNLIDNAWSFSEQGAAIKVDVSEEGGVVVVEISDDGPGIPANKLEAIFNRFYSERPKEEIFGRHSGLGLSISRQIVEAHGGTLTARNKEINEGKGAIFRMELPA
jgi:two-component system, OmpR family, sensor histidine kinase ChvG